jgi:hypothetical protein
MAKPITELTKDIRKLIETGRETAGPVIIRSLQSEGPWWTSSFGRKWQLSQTAVKPTDDRPGFDRELTGPIPAKTKFPKPTEGSPLTVSSLRFPITTSMYVGNSTSYAGFAVNNPNATVPRRGGGAATYEEHKIRDKRELTSADQNPDWYKVYTKSGGLLGDLDKVFKATRLG